MSFNLPEWQKVTMSLIEGGSYCGSDRALRELAGSDRVEIVRDIVRSWRELRIRTSCPLTTAQLEERGLFSETIAAASRGGASAYREAFALAFLEHVASHFDDPDLQDIAGFEAEMIRVHHGG